ncbi:outer membrane beta-barrel protein [Luteolibacter ambystomatis]|uniref:Outer membrane beta-barrel protein n=1 Tax=Luteolibacter ambystomatis TaxID=2824561 RepID=A0A975J005_9BACT|nr:outer membrane beta-barrel protein [Luteolibacter ambystomatis]QUE51105.1 outer membrane beta-barrel protein [Luteolibacter ambystomatis]
MKKAIPMLIALAGPVWAGEVHSSKAPIPPPQDSCLCDWFVGASAGYLLDFEEPMYTLQFGRDLPVNLGGWCMATYLELGYTDKSANRLVDFQRQVFVNFDEELQVIPLTLNVKFERPITDNLNVFIGAGLGVAFTEFESRSTIAQVKESDTSFAAQAFIGLAYNVNKDFQIYGGARWIYVDFEAPSTPLLFGSSDLDFDSQALLELGARFKF